MSSEPFSPVKALLMRGVTSRAYPGAVLEVGGRAGVKWRMAAGRLTYDADDAGVEEDTIFDLASLTKVIVTATLAMRLVEARRLSLADKVSSHVLTWLGESRVETTLRDLLEHCSGLPAWLPLYREHQGRHAFEHAIASVPLEYHPWTRSIYSDLGFILFGFIVEDVGGSPLSDQFARVTTALEFIPHDTRRGRIAPTELDPISGKALIGEVHDENARALGGVAGHAGLFGTAAAVGDFARLVLRTYTEETALGRPDTLRRFVTRSTVPGSSRALAWDTMLLTSSCGTRMSPRAIGHVGFAGTSLWIDPEHELYVVLLTNRVHPTRENNAIRELRPAIHDAILQALA
jgi:CubicO group peptidase (beta-lactamase class C family)